MKQFVVFMVGLIALAGVAVGQINTGNPLVDVQFMADEIHDMYEGTFDNVRFYMSDILDDQNDDILDAVLAVMDSWNVKRNEARNCGCANRPRIQKDGQQEDRQTGCGCANRPRVQSLELVLEKLIGTLQTPAQGEAVRQCTNTASALLNARTTDVLMAIERSRYYSTDLQMRVSDELADFNIVLYYFNFYEFMEPKVLASYNRLQNEVGPELEFLIGELEFNRDELVGNLRNCLTAAVQNIVA